MYYAYVLLWIVFYLFLTGSFRLYDINHDGYISRDEMISVVDSIYRMVVCNDTQLNDLHKDTTKTHIVA